MQEQLNDTELWESIKKGDEKAFSVLYERYWSKIFTTSFNYIKDREVCSDIVHDLFLTIWQKRNRLEIASIGNYLQCAARYHVYKQLKRSSTSHLVYMDEWKGIDEPASLNDGDENIQYLELEEMVETRLKKLPKRCQEIFFLSRKEQLSNTEIAEHLTISKRTVENQITIALRLVRTVLKVLVLVVFSC